MYKDRYNDSLVRFFSVYYEKISENEVKSIINYTLGLKNDRFSRFIENGKRVDNILDLLEIKYLKINNIIYILESEKKLSTIRSRCSRIQRDFRKKKFRIC